MSETLKVLSEEQAQVLTEKLLLNDKAIKDELNSKIPTDYLTSIPSEYVTEEEMQQAIANASIGGEVDLSGYALKTDMPTKVSQLSNDIGYLTEHQDLSGYAPLSALESKSNVGHTHIISDITDYVEPNLSDYATKSEIPDVSDFVTESQMNEAIANISTGGTVDLSGYATKTELNGKADVEHTHSIDDITDYSAPDLSGYATESYVEQKITEVNTGGSVDLGNYYAKSEVYNKEEVDVLTDGVGEVHIGNEPPVNNETFWFTQYEIDNQKSVEEIVIDYLNLHKNELKGDKGDKGEQGLPGADGQPGYTPIKGTDYWTASDIAEIQSYINQQIGGAINGSY